MPHPDDDHPWARLEGALLDPVARSAVGAEDDARAPERPRVLVVCRDPELGAYIRLALQSAYRLQVAAGLDEVLDRGTPGCELILCAGPLLPVGRLVGRWRPGTSPPVLLVDPEAGWAPPHGLDVRGLLASPFNADRLMRTVARCLHDP